MALLRLTRLRPKATAMKSPSRNGQDVIAGIGSLHQAVDPSRLQAEMAMGRLSAPSSKSRQRLRGRRSNPERLRQRRCPKPMVMMKFQTRRRIQAMSYRSRKTPTLQKKKSTRSPKSPPKPGRRSNLLCKRSKKTPILTGLQESRSHTRHYVLPFLLSN